MPGVLRRRGKETHREREDNVKTESEIGEGWPQVNGNQGLPEAGREKEGFFLGANTLISSPEAPKL